MTLPTTNMSLGDIQSELGGSNPISMSEYYAGGGITPSGTNGTGGAIPTSGQINMGKFRSVAGSSFFSTIHTSYDTTKWFANPSLITMDLTLYGTWPNLSGGTSNNTSWSTSVYGQSNTNTSTIPEWSNRIELLRNLGTSAYGFNIAADQYDDDVDRYLDIQQWIVPVNCSYVVIDAWGAGGGGGSGYSSTSASTHGGAGMYCRTYLYVGTHISAGDIITICAGIPGIAGPTFSGGVGGGSSFAWLTNTYTAARLARDTVSNTTDSQKRNLLKQVTSTNVILCAAGGGGGGSNAASNGSGNHGGGGGNDAPNVYGIHEGTTSGTKGGPSANSNTYILPEPNTIGSTTSYAGITSPGADSVWNNRLGNDISLTARTSNSTGFRFYHMIMPTSQIMAQETGGGFYSSGSYSGAGTWFGVGGARMYSADTGSNRGCRGGGGGGGGVYKGQSTQVTNGNSYSPGTTSGALGSISTSHCYGGQQAQYNVNNQWLGGSGKPGHIKIKFY